MDPIGFKTSPKKVTKDCEEKIQTRPKKTNHMSECGSISIGRRTYPLFWKAITLHLQRPLNGRSRAEIFRVIFFIATEGSDAKFDDDTECVLQGLVL